MTTTEATAPPPKVRITKDPDVRREELLDIALDLCRTQGFDALRVEQIVQTAGVAKGTFYHYFASKDAVLEALVQRFGEGLFARLSDAAGTAKPAAERLRAVMDAAQSFKLAQGEVPLASMLMREENLAMRHRVYQVWREHARRVLSPLIADGAKDYSFDVADVDGAVDIILLLWFDAADRLWERALTATDEDSFADIMIGGSVSIAQAQERVLGVPAGTYAIAIPPDVVTMTKQLFHSIDRSRS